MACSRLLAPWLLVALLLIAGTECTNSGGTTSRSLVIPVYHQAASFQPYPRSAQSKAMSISLGTGGNKVAYKFTVDTGSGVLLATCRTPSSLANCGSLPADKNYVLSPAATVTDQATCAATGIGCMLSPSNTCFLSEQLTGGGGISNINNGIVAKDTITWDNATTLTVVQRSSKGTTQTTINRKAAPVSFTGLFGCAEAYKQCTSTSAPDCILSASNCPAGATPSDLFQGQCPESGNGIEAGWTFNVGGPASAMAVPEQAYQAGLISKKVTGFCYVRPQKDLNCRATIKPSSAVVLGSALPRALRSASRLYKAPLIPAVFPDNVQPNQAIPQTHTFRSNVQGVTVPVYGSSTPWTDSEEDLSGVSILWDSGAYGQSTVTTATYGAFVRYFEAAWGAVNASQALQRYGFVINKCPDVGTVCGDNIDSSALHSCLQISLPQDASVSMRQAARQVLSSLYAPSIRIMPVGGGVVKLPTAFVLNLCSGQDNCDTSGVAVCSYIQAPNIPGSGGYFWLAGPFFTNRFVQFDASGPMPGYPSSTGTILWSDPVLSSCEF